VRYTCYILPRSVQYCAVHLLYLTENCPVLCGTLVISYRELSSTVRYTCYILPNVLLELPVFITKRCVRRSLAVMKVGCMKEEEEVKEKNKEFLRKILKMSLYSFFHTAPSFRKCYLAG
jgi:hypothetical protein